MKQLFDLFQKETRLAIGLMSGTSLDGIDAVLVEIKGSGPGTKARQVDFITLPFPAGLKEFILRNSQSGTSDVAEIARLNFLIAQLYAEAVFALCKHAGVDARSVDMIGSHGQTIQHLPQKVRMFGKDVSATLQIGDPSVIAKLTGIITIADFRVGDVALGGQGAPLVPYFDFIFFRSDKVSRALLNIGGIANITFLPKGCRENDVMAFDTGPGNMLVDQLANELFGKTYDDEGQIAISGKVLGDMLDFLMKDEFIRKAPPKSTGREQYGRSFITTLMTEFGDRKKEDMIATATQFTATSVYSNYLLFLKTISDIDELLVSGGGAHNPFLMNALRELFVNTKVATAETGGISADSKEAVCFAVLANETISGNPTNLPRVTGAERTTMLGKICLP